MSTGTAVAATAAGVAFAAAATHSELALALLAAARAWVEARAGSLLLTSLVCLIAIYQVTTHVFHPAIIAVFGGKPKVVLTQDHVAEAFSPVREVFLRNMVQGRSLAVQCVVFQAGERVVDLCGAPEPITVKPPPPPPRGEDGDEADEEDEEEQAMFEWATDPDAYHPHAVQPVWGASCALAALAAAVAVDRGWIAYDKRVKEFWPEFKGESTVSELLREADRTEAGPVALAVLLEKVDPLKRSLGVFVQEEISDKLQLGGGLRHASSVAQATATAAAGAAGAAAADGKGEGKATKQKQAAKPAAAAAAAATPKTEEEWQAAMEAAARAWYPLVDSELSEVPSYKLELCAAVAAIRGWSTAAEAPTTTTPTPTRTPRPARGGWLANGRSLGVLASVLAQEGRTADGLLLIRKETLRQATSLMTTTTSTAAKRDDADTAAADGDGDGDGASEQQPPQQLMGRACEKTTGGWAAAAHLGGGTSGGGEQQQGKSIGLVGSAGCSGGWLAWSPSLQLGVGVAASGEFPESMGGDPAHPMRLLAQAVLESAEAAAAAAAVEAPGAAETPAE